MPGFLKIILWGTLLAIACIVALFAIVGLIVPNIGPIPTAIPSAGSGAPPPARLQAYTLTLVRLPLHAWVGNAVYLGKGRILTAAHVAGHYGNPPPPVDFAGVTLTTTRIKQGRFEDIDLAELAVDPNALPKPIQALPPLPICGDDPDIGTEVLVITPTQIASSHTVSSAVLPDRLFPPDVIQEFPTLIADVYSTGNSGSALFDRNTGCLLGIMSRKFEVTKVSIIGGAPIKHVFPLAKYFVGPRVIRAFLAGTGAP
jgi:hypothetical protein